MFKKLILTAAMCLVSAQIFSNVLMHVELTIEENKSEGTFDLKDGEAALIQLNENLCLALHVMPKEQDAITVVLEVIAKNPETLEFELVSNSSVETAWSTVAQFDFSDAPISLKMVAIKNDVVAEASSSATEDGAANDQPTAEEAHVAEQTEQN